MAEDHFELADTFAEVARCLLSEHGEKATLQRICELAVETIGTCEHAGVSVMDRRRIRSIAASDAVPEAVDHVQDEVQEGPCLDALVEHEVFVTAALSQEERWPSFSRRAFEASGVESIMSFRLYSDGETLGVINLFSKQQDAFHDNDIHLGSIFAAHAAVAFSAMQKQEQFDEALESRDVIGKAKGILMARSGVSEEEAFEMLRSASQRMNRKLREVARSVAGGAPPSGETCEGASARATS